MTKEQYETLDRKHQIMYDDMVSFCRRLTDRMEEVTELLKTLITMAND